MSDSANAGDAPTGVDSPPRALIHKKILETAASMPEATMAEVAEEVSGASTDLVERVLQEYGDPAAASTEGDPSLATDGDQPTGETAASSGPSGSTGDAGPAGDVASTGDPEPPDGTTSSDDTASAPDGSGASGDPPGGAANTGGSPGEQASTGDSPVAQADSGDRSGAQAGTGRSGTGTAPDEAPVRDPGDLTEKERAVLEVVAERPAATQQEVANVLGVSRATVSKRASGIEGFDWSDRASFVERLYGTAGESEPVVRGNTDAPTVSRSSLASAARTDGDRQRTGDRTRSPPDPDRSSASGERTADREDIVARLDRIETRLDALVSGEAAGTSGGITDPELAHKVVHACMESEHVSEAEELEVVAAVLQGDAPE